MITICNFRGRNAKQVSTGALCTAILRLSVHLLRKTEHTIKDQTRIIVGSMKHMSRIASSDRHFSSARLLSSAFGFAAIFGAALLLAPQIAVAQDGTQRQSIFIDGSTPVDAHTRARVDAYFDEIENREQAKAEERTRFDRFIYQDNTFGAQQFGRW